MEVHTVSAISKRQHTRSFILVDLEKTINIISKLFTKLFCILKALESMLEVYIVHYFYTEVINFVLLLLSFFILENKSVAYA